MSVRPFVRLSLCVFTFVLFASLLPYFILACVFPLDYCSDCNYRMKYCVNIIRHMMNWRKSYLLWRSRNTPSLMIIHSWSIKSTSSSNTLFGYVHFWLFQSGLYYHILCICWVCFWRTLGYVILICQEVYLVNWRSHQNKGIKLTHSGWLLMLIMRRFRWDMIS